MSTPNWVSSNPADIGHQAIDTNSTTQNHPLGKIMQAHHATYGGGEFIYLKGVASTVVGSVVIYNDPSYDTVLVTNTAEQGAPVTVAMAATVASEFGWYQIAGLAVVKKTAVAVGPKVPIYLSGTAGRVKVIASEGLGIVGARTANSASTTSTTSTVLVSINRPHLQGFRS